MRSAIAIIALTLALPATAAAGLSIGDSGRTVTHDCSTDPDVAVMGSQNTITLTGTCAKVAITGSMNTLVIEAAAHVAVTGSSNTIDVAASDKISLTGAQNKVKYVKGLKRKSPRISKTGLGNKVTKVKSISSGGGGGGGGGTTGDAPATQPSAPGGGDAVISGKSRSLTHDCGTSGSVRIEISNSRIAITGACSAIHVLGSSNSVFAPSAGTITIPGNSNTVAVDVAGEVATLGNRNRVSYKRTSTGKDLKVTNPGKDNVIAIAK